jgi:hypothetical protein
VSDELFDDAGPESRGPRGTAFEDQLEAMGETLGWARVCRNVDIFIKGKPGPSRGLDILWSLRNPQLDRKEGWIEEGKNHDTPAPGALGGEIQTLHDKIARFQNMETFRKHPEIQRHVEALVGGMVAHRSKRFEPAKAREALLNFELRNTQRGVQPIEILFYGPDSLEALADTFGRHGKPASFYWPPTSSRDGDGVWAPGCPPRQIAAGVLAYKTSEDEVVLWWRDGLIHHDIDSLSAIVRAWGIDIDVVVCSFLDRDQQRVVRDAWARAAEHAGERRHGRLPKEVEARDLGLDRMNSFDDQWPAAA